jgi:hypothetical protein
MNTTLNLWNPQQAHQALSAAWSTIKPLLLAGHRLQVQIKPERRSNDQNRLMWVLLSDLSTQVDWHGQKLEPGEWKDVLTASLKRQKVVPGLDGGFVVLGSSTSRMDKHEFSELLELIQAFGAQQGVTFSEPLTP